VRRNAKLGLDGGIVIFNLGNRREWNLYDLTVGAFDLHTRRGQGLSCFHTFNRAAHSLAIGSNNLDVVLAVKGLQRGECFGYLQLNPP